MASTESLSRTIADTVTLSEELREEGKIDGQVKLYNVDEDDEFESDADTFFQRTLMTQGLRESFTDLRDTLGGDQNFGTHILYGPYGSGKSHQMVALYHCFASPDASGAWGRQHIEGFDDALPDADNSEAVTVSLQQKQPDYLWEPFFDALDYDPGSFESGGWPDMETIQDAVDGRTVAFLMDELEDWYETLEGDRRKSNRMFLQSFLETTELEDENLFAIVSVLRKGSQIHNILHREDATVSEINISNKVSKREVIRHRLIGDVDHDAVDEIVDGYLDAYDSDHVDEIPSGLADDMRETYPFHPELIKTLKTRYYADDENQNTRGMIYLLSQILTNPADPDAGPEDSESERLIEQTDLITHSDIDAILFDDELTRINFDRPSVCADDIRNRVHSDEIPYGRRILNTVLIYSLKPDEGEGADKTQIIMGTYETGDLVADIVLNLEQLYGIAWYLHKLNGRYAVRDKPTPTALIQNEATDVDEEVAMGKIAETVRDVFGNRAQPVGFEENDLKDVPDGRDLKVVVNSNEWTPDDVETVITNADGSPGREWRNTLVFIEPNEDKEIASGTGFVEKARYIRGAELVLQKTSLDDSIRETVEQQKQDEIRELRDRVELAYGRILDGNDLLNNFGDAAHMDLEVYVMADDDLDADTIADEVAADPFDLQTEVWQIVEDLLDRRDEASIEDIYEQFLRQPSYPIPGSPNDVLNATVEALDDKPVVTHGSNGFSDSLTGSSLDTVLLHEDNVERWSPEDVEQELRQRFGSGEQAVDVGNFELELLNDTEVWLEGDGHDTVMTAVGRLAQEDKYVLYSGKEIVSKADSDRTLRDISDAETIDTPEVRARVDDELTASGKADTGRILGEIRRDESVYLPEDSTERAFREAVNDFLVDEYVLAVGQRYEETLGDREPGDVTLVPTVDESVGTQILDYIGGLDVGEEFTVGKVAERFDSSVSENAVETFLLEHLGREEDPAYVVGPTGSDDPADWSPGFPFRVPGTEDWHFKYDGDDVTDLRTKWRSEEQPGEVSYGEVRFVLANREGIPGPLQGTANIAETTTKLTLEPGEDVTAVRDLFERMPEEASSISVEINFE